MKKYALLSVFFTAVFAIVSTTKLSSHLASPPAGSSGDPFTTLTCVQSGCHPGPVQTPNAGDYTLDTGIGTPTTPLNSSFTYTPGTTYTFGLVINLSVTAPDYYGFQIVALDNTAAQAGTMNVTNATHTEINTLQGRQYMGHKNAVASFKNWSFQWTAPAAGTGPVTFYYCFNTATASTNPPTLPEGTIYHSSVTIQEGTGSGIENIFDKISELNIFPNPVSNEFGLSFDLKKAEKISAQLYSLDGKLSKELFSENATEGNFNRSYNVNDISSGIYFIKLNVGDASVTKKVVKL